MARESSCGAVVKARPRLLDAARSFTADLAINPDRPWGVDLAPTLTELIKFRCRLASAHNFGENAKFGI